jgi:uncharacterized damage-inducible protein DinB
MALIARDRMKATGQPQPLPWLRPRAACNFTTREFVCQRLLEFLRYEGIHHRGAAHLLGRQVLRQIPQAGAHRTASR